MPYTNIDSLPVYVKKYSVKLQRQFMHVFNTTYAKVLKETKSSKDAEVRAVKAGNSILKKRFKGKDSMTKNNRTDYFTHMVDSWLGNLEG